MDKLLYLVRHAKSSWADMGMRDFDRPLNKRGLRDAPEMGRRLRKLEAAPSIVLCSPALRTRQTSELLLREMQVSTDCVLFESSIYEASTTALLQLIRNLPDHCATAMLIGHNPAVGCLVNQLAGNRIDQMPTCAVATIRLAVEQWKLVANLAGQLIDFDFPKRI